MAVCSAMSSSTDVTELELRELGRLVAAREVSPVELTETFLERIATRICTATCA